MKNVTGRFNVTADNYTKPYDYRYIGNKDTLVVHDLENDQPDCRVEDLIEAFILAGNNPKFDLFRSLDAAHLMGYRNCPVCLKNEGTEYGIAIS